MFKKTIPLVACLAVLAMSYAFAQSPASRQVPKQWSGGGYLEYLPAGYDSTSAQLYPAIIFLHGSGQRGTGTPTELTKLLDNGPPKMIKNGHDMCFPNGTSTECFIVLSPQTNKWDFENVGAPFARWAKTKYKIDPDRLFVTGLSMGGRGSWTANYETLPGETLFKAIVPVSANGSSLYGTTAEANNTRVWALHGSSDNTITIADGKVPLDAMVKIKADPAPIFTIEPGGHNDTFFDRAYNTGHTYRKPNIYEWLLSLNNLTVNGPPTVSSPAQTITWPTNSITLSATASDPEGDTITSYYWFKKNGGALAITDFKDFTTANLKLTNLQPGSHNFIVLAVNNKGQHAYGDVLLWVNQLPVVNAGVDKVVTLPATTTTLTATASDPNPGGSIKSYLWTKVSGPASGVIGNATTATASLSQLVQGVYVFQIKVTDNLNAIATDQVQVTVSSSNASPVANAGVDKSITLPVNSTTLTGAGTDSDGSIASYAWTQQGGPSTATLSGTSTTTLSASALIEGTYTFRLTVTDNLGATGFDEVLVTVSPAQQPVVVFRVNSGGLEITNAVLNWGLDKEGADPTRRSPYLDLSNATYTTGSNSWTGPNTTGAPNDIFGSNRYATTVGPLNWHFPTGNGLFQVNLYFAEKGGTGAVTGAGQRIFDVNAEGTLAFDDVDIYAEAGMTALKREAQITVADGTLDLSFVRNVNNPQVNGIEIIRLSSAGARTAIAAPRVTADVEVYGARELYVYPNPLERTTYVQFREPQNGPLSLRVAGSDGKAVREIQLTGNNTLRIILDLPIETMSSGVYLLEVKTSAGRSVIKLFNK